MKKRPKPVSDAPRMELPLQRPAIEESVRPLEDDSSETECERGAAVIDFFI